MYKRTGDSCHFLPRKASFSTVPQRNGRVDVMPPSAVDNLYLIANQISDGNARIERLSHERQAVTDELNRVRQVDMARLRFNTDARLNKPDPRIAELREREDCLSRDLRQLRKHVGDLRALIGGAEKLSVPQIFFEIAKAQLPQATFDAILQTANDIAKRGQG